MDLDKIKELAKKAFIAWKDSEVPNIWLATCSADKLRADCGYTDDEINHIAALDPQTVLEIIKRIQEQEKEIERLKGLVDYYQNIILKED